MADDASQSQGDSFWELNSQVQTRYLHVFCCLILFTNNHLLIILQNDGEEWDNQSEISALSGAYSQSDASAATNIDVSSFFFLSAFSIFSYLDMIV